jgi:hypothetical protein
MPASTRRSDTSSGSAPDPNGGAVPMRFVLPDEVHVSVLVPPELPPARADEVCQALGQPAFLRPLRHAVRRALAGLSTPVVVRLAR